MKKQSLFQLGILIALGVICVALVGIDFVYHRHAASRYEALPGFYAAVGFFAVLLSVFVARFIVGPLLRREEDYYD